MGTKWNMDENGIITTPMIMGDGAGQYLKVPVLTTAERNALTPVNGMIIFNISAGVFEKYNGSWKSFADGTFPNVAIVSIPAKSWGTVNIMKPAWDAIYTVTQKRNSQTGVPTSGTTKAGTTTTLVVDNTKLFYQLTSIVKTQHEVGNLPAGQVKVDGNIQIPVGVNGIVHDVNTGEWGYITSFIANNHANVANFTLAHNNGNIIEFYVPVTGGYYRNVSLGINRGIASYSFATPDRFTLSAAIPGQGVGDSYIFSPGIALWQWDEAGFNVMKPTPIATSNPPMSTELNIYNKSDKQMDFIVSWM